LKQEQPVTVTGYNVIVSTSITVNCTLGTVTVTGYNPEVEVSTTVDCTLGTVTVTGYNVIVSATTTIDCTLGTVVVAGYNVIVLNEPIGGAPEPGLFADFLEHVIVLDKTAPRVSRDRIAYDELVGLQNRIDPRHPPQCEAKDEVQVLSKFTGSVSSGNYTITIIDELGVGHTTANIAYDADATAIESAIDVKMTADSYIGWVNGHISVALTGDLTTNDATLTFDGTSVTEKNFGQTIMTNVDLTGGTVGDTSTVQHGQPIRYTWSIIWALGIYETPPEYGELLSDPAIPWAGPGENPNWPGASLREVLAAQAAIDDGVPDLRYQLEDLFNVQGK
jgi:hypothetical protein